MKLSLIVSFSLIIVLSIQTIGCLDEKDTGLELIQILFRHGDRTPIRSYPFDPYNETVWSLYGGYGQLTQTGIKRAYDFGEFLRNKYPDFIAKFYNRDQVLVKSTDYDRTLMTASSLLAGLYPPNGYQIWSNNTLWQPIPIHTNDVKSDNLFYMKECPLAKELYEQVKQTDEFKKYISENSNFIQKLNTEIGSNSNVTIDDMEHIADGIFIQKENKMKIPIWAENNYDKIVQLGAFIYNFYYLTPQQARLAAGGLMNQFRLDIQNKIANKSMHTKLHLYSGHDTYVAALVRLLNLTTHLVQPPYVSALVIELRRSLTDESQYFVQCFYKNNTIYEKINLNKLKIASCSSELCPLEEFLTITQNLIVDDFQNECKITERITKIRLGFLFYMSIGMTFIFSILFSIFSILNYFQFKNTISKHRCNMTRQYETVNLIIGDFDNEDDEDNK